MSELLPDDEPAQSLRAQSSLDVSAGDIAAGKPWIDRWVDFEPSESPVVARQVCIVQIAPPAVEHKSMLTLSPHDVVLLVEALYRNDLT